MLPAQFLADLQSVYCQLRAPVSTSFRADLYTVHMTLSGDVSASHASADILVDFEWLGSRLERWRERSRKKLQEQLSRLPADDPLRCPISLFATMDYGRLETAHTRTLAWLLDPTKEHGFGHALLRALLGEMCCPLPAFSVDRVESERSVALPRPGERGRLDVCAEGQWQAGGGWLLVVEAKIAASEGAQQLDDYDDWIDTVASDRDVFRIFLTPDGRDSETGRAAWLPWSFSCLAGLLRNTSDGLRQAEGYHFLRYYLSGVLQDVCGWKFSRNEGAAADPYQLLDYLANILGP